jgi:hypothetical protein
MPKYQKPTLGQVACGRESGTLPGSPSRSTYSDLPQYQSPSPDPGSRQSSWSKRGLLTRFPVRSTSLVRLAQTRHLNHSGGTLTPGCSVPDLLVKNKPNTSSDSEHSLKRGGNPCRAQLALDWIPVPRTKHCPSHSLSSFEKKSQPGKFIDSSRQLYMLTLQKPANE